MNESKSISINIIDINSKDSIELMNELSAELEKITGNSGKNSFDPDEFSGQGNIFVLAYLNDEPVGCGAVRKFNENTAEIKRVYSKYKGLGIGRKIVNFLENQASSLGYKEIILETRKINYTAVNFYEHLGYKIIPNFGKYIDRKDAVCFGKHL